MFQSTHPHGVRLPPVGLSPASSSFQSTHPHGVRLWLNWITDICITFQSTHPHGVRRQCIRLERGYSKFQSTHPHGVRLRVFCERSEQTKVSIHAPTRGATSLPNNYPNIYYVSIHAPTRGATKPATREEPPAGFQSTHPHGVRLSGLKGAILRTKFQSTHPHGVRQYIFQSADFLTYTLIFLRTFHGIKLKSNRLTKKRCNWFIISECDWYTIYVPL